MPRKNLLVVLLFLVLAVSNTLFAQGSPPEEAIQNWRDLGFGMFIHWGPVSQTGHEIGWSRGKQTPVEKYDQLYRTFNPQKFDADRWARIADEAGMKYVVITTKHHDGFCLWPSDHTDYDIANTPYNKDVVGALAEACRKRGIKFGTYYSVCDWHHPEFPRGSPGGNSRKPGADLDQYISYLRNQTRELVNRYDPFVMWYDVPQEVGPKHGKPTVKMLREMSPDILINNRAYGGFSGDFSTPEQEVGEFNRKHPWETCMTIATQWAWKPNDRMKSLKTCLRNLLKAVGGDGNFLFNVGPRPDGRIHPPQAERLREMGNWLEQYGEGVYGTRGGPFKPGDWGVSTNKGNKIYLFVMNWPGADYTLTLPDIPQEVTNVHALTPVEPKLTEKEDTLQLSLDREPSASIASVIELTVSGRAFDIEPRAVSTDPSLSYRKPAKASNVYQGDKETFGPSKAVDGDQNTRWATDGDVHAPWIQIDLEQPTRIAGIRIHEEYGKRIQSHALEYRVNGEWKTIYSGKTVGPEYKRTFDPVKARAVRLNIHDATKGPTISEIQLFAPRK